MSVRIHSYDLQYRKGGFYACPRIYPRRLTNKITTPAKTIAIGWVTRIGRQEFARDLKYGIIIIPLLYRLHMTFEYDPKKSAENKRKHGLDFEEAQALWADTNLVEVPARTDDEPRWLVVGDIDGKHWSAVITRRGDNIRLISVRRSRDEEVAIYESEDV